MTQSIMDFFLSWHDLAWVKLHLIVSEFSADQKRKVWTLKCPLLHYLSILLNQDECHEFD